MKKLALVILVIPLVVAIIVFMQDSEQLEKDVPDRAELSTQKQHVDSTNTADIDIKNAQKKEELSKLESIMNSDEEKPVFDSANNIFEKQLECISDKSCLQDQNARFYDSKLDPAMTILRKSLELLNKVSLDDSSRLNDINTDDLLKVVATGHISSSFLAYTILLRKGNNDFLRTKDIAMNFDGNTAVNYIQQFKNSMLLTDENAIAVRDEVVKHYIQNKDQNTAFGVIKELTLHPVSEGAVSEILEISCKKHGPFTTEPKKILLNQLNKLAKAINQESACQ